MVFCAGGRRDHEWSRKEAWVPLSSCDWTRRHGTARTYTTEVKGRAKTPRVKGTLGAHRSRYTQRLGKGHDARLHRRYSVCNLKVVELGVEAMCSSGLLMPRRSHSCGAPYSAILRIKRALPQASAFCFLSYLQPSVRLSCRTLYPCNSRTFVCTPRKSRIPEVQSGRLKLPIKTTRGPPTGHRKLASCDECDT